MILTEMRNQCGVCVRMWNEFWAMRWWLVFVLLAGYLAALLTPASWLETTFPIVTMQATIVQKTPTEVIISLNGEKPWYTAYRGCKYQAIDAYSDVGMRLRDLNIERTDKPETGFTRPPGVHDFGTWRIWPTTNTRLVAIYVTYDCDGKQVHVRAAEIAL